LYKQFIDEAPCGYIPKNDFHQLTELMGIKDPFITSLVFNAFDTNTDGNIQFDEFIRGMSVMTRGSPDEKLEFAFRLYDLDNDGYITKVEMVKIVTALYRMLGDLVSLQGEEYDSPVKLVDKIFKDMDLNKDGKLSMQEYKMGAQKDPAIIQGLSLY
jgi:Ca2+-binding EF-hand superfamily protein